MANPEHLAILKQGVEVWNVWREEHPEVTPDLSEEYPGGVDLQGAKLYLANLKGVDLRRANLRRAHLVRVDLFRAFLPNANLVEASLQRASLVLTYLGKADLEGADLEEADLQGAILDGTSLCKANLENALIGGTIFSNTDLNSTEGLDWCRHVAPSIIDSLTLAKNPHLAVEFLRGCGLSDLEIEFAKLYRNDLSDHQITDITYRLYELRAVGSVQYYSCFISYSSKEDAFAHKLHDDLQEAGVRCWFAPEDMKIGDRIRPVIHDAIRLHDKLLLILSEHSVGSQWVEDEVERALEKERQDGSAVLFPVRLDAAVMDSNEGWASYLKRTRNIGDFTRWQDPDLYNQAFQRLLRDLKAGP